MNHFSVSVEDLYRHCDDAVSSDIQFAFGFALSRQNQEAQIGLKGEEKIKVELENVNQ